MDRTVDGVFGKESKDRSEERGELCLAHLAAAHGEFAMTNTAEGLMVRKQGRDEIDILDIGLALARQHRSAPLRTEVAAVSTSDPSQGSTIRSRDRGRPRHRRGQCGVLDACGPSACPPKKSLSGRRGCSA